LFNEVGGLFHDEERVCSGSIKTIKEGQMFIISSVPLHELPESCKSICKSFWSLSQFFTLDRRDEESEPEDDAQIKISLPKKRSRTSLDQSKK
jgi:hypothetical protein